jgi:predicted CoA-substrate-specific enzyme activase
VVTQGLRDIESELGGRIEIRGVGATGSGRELIGELVGADTVNDEITAHKTGATFIGQKMLGGRVPDTIFEIGGQDSKYISLQDGVVVDFTMNEACAAGTGSFLEERAEELDIAIVNEFAELALSSSAPIRLGERCTVFMERDVNDYLQRGASKADLVAGLAFSVVYNYINRVVRGRKIGDCVFFQGGTAYNDAVAAAFSAVTGKEIVVPPFNGVMGAIGSALLARDKMTASVEQASRLSANASARLEARRPRQAGSLSSCQTDSNGMGSWRGGLAVWAPVAGKTTIGCPQKAWGEMLFMSLGGM